MTKEIHQPPQTSVLRNEDLPSEKDIFISGGVTACPGICPQAGFSQKPSSHFEALQALSEPWHTDELNDRQP